MLPLLLSISSSSACSCASIWAPFDGSFPCFLAWLQGRLCQTRSTAFALFNGWMWVTYRQCWVLLVQRRLFGFLVLSHLSGCPVGERSLVLWWFVSCCLKHSFEKIGTYWNRSAGVRWEAPRCSGFPSPSRMPWGLIALTLCIWFVYLVKIGMY